jgi:Uma2 family endonuclease
MNAAPKWPLPTHKNLPCSEEEARRNGARKFALPTHKDLPETDGRPMENAIQVLQIALLSAVLRPVLEALHPDGRFFIGRDVGIYYRLVEPPFDGCKAPDWFYVADVDPLRNGEYRRSYVLWNEPQRPTLVVEFASGDGADEHDTTPWRGKFWTYEQMIQAPYFAIFSADTGRLEVFELVTDQYRLGVANEQGRFTIPPLGVELGVWHGSYENYTLPWLRAYRPDGSLLPTPEELAEQERRAKEVAEARAARLAEMLRQMGVNPEQLP